MYEFYCKGKKTLDVGCGEGEFLKLGKDHVYGVDLNKRAIEGLKNDGYQVALGDVTKMPYGNNEFEVVHCHNVIEHMDIGAALSMLHEIGRVLAPGGRLVLSSETVTKKFWETFGHVKPYPPNAVIKLLREDSRESFEGLSEFEYEGVFYIGDYYKNKLLYLFSFCIGYLTPFFRREYFLVLKKR